MHLPLSRLTISIVSHGHGPLVVQLLNDLDLLPSLRGAVVVITLNLLNEQLDTTRIRHLRIELIRNTNPKGFGANHNEAFRRCETEWFGVLNPDLRVTDDVFSELLAAVVDNAGIALVAPRVLNSAGGIEDSVRENLTPWSILKRTLTPHPRPRPPAGKGFRWYAGMFYLIRSSAYAALGGFDERYFLYCEDYDLCARMYLEGRQLVHMPSVTVVHDAQRNSHRSGRHLRLHLASLLRVWRSTPVWRIAMALRARAP